MMKNKTQYDIGELLNCEDEGLVVVDAKYEDLRGETYYIILDEDRAPAVVDGGSLSRLPQHFKNGHIV